MSQKQYWKGLEELHNTADHKEVVENEFKEDLPFDLSGKLLDANTPRRDFLKFLGFSTAAATLAASCEMPVRKAIPYAIKPEEIVPGVANYYASTFVDGGDYCAVVVKTRDGRPIKVEGNEKSSITKGGTSARVQASVLNLYDTARLRQPFADGNEATFEAIDRAVKEGLSASGETYILTSTILSPTTKDVIAKFIAKYPNAKHVTYDAMSYSGMLLANEASYGKRTLPSYHFENAKTIVGLGADFLGTWLSPVEFAKGYSKGRKVSAKNPEMSKHYQVEPTHTITGAKADMRATCRPSEMGKVAVALYNAVVNGTKPNVGSEKLNATIANAAKDLKKGSGLVVCGDNDMDIQMVVNAINSHIGANGTTINWAVTSNYKQGIDSDMVALTEAMKSGKVGALLMHGVNPVYDYYNGAAFAEGLGKVATTVSFADRMDETAQACKFVVPDHNYLESWGDAEPKSGYYSLQQPGIAPLFKTRAFQDSLLTWADAGTTYGDYWKSYWMNRLGGQKTFDMALQDGVIEPNEMSVGGASFAGDVTASINNINSRKAITDKEVVLYQKISIGYGGAWSNNPWLQEMPDPITKATWDNYLCVSPKTAKDWDEELTSITEVVSAKRVVKMVVNGQEVELPIVVVPGMHNDVVAVAVGYGRAKEVGMAARSGLDKWGKEIGGKNVYPMVSFNGKTFSYSAAVTSLDKTESTYDVAITQTHHSYEGRPIIHEYTLDEFKKDPNHLENERKKELEHYTHLSWEHEEDHGGGHGDGHAKAPMASHSSTDWQEDFRKNGTLYPVYESPGIHWGMSIDMSSCIGCGACVVGCQAENNVSVVGKTHVLKSQEMHWIRIDRYFSGDPEDADSIQTVFQPMMCQHCDNAPCENVCPVSATNHSSEGLNQMAYNRCIGTKYCANNCPYKVRHFNWMDWNGADCFDDNLYEDYRRDEMNSDLTRMVLNPDVTVRSRGVMEKCSFCVQRLQDAKLAAKKDGKPMQDGTARTACQQACPTDAIVFGNVNDKNSAIYQLRKNEQRERVNYVLESIHTLPNINYLSVIRNTDEVIAGNEDKDKLMNPIVF